MQQASDLLPLGRANVKEDIEKAKDAYPRLRHVASYKLRSALREGAGNPAGAVPKSDYHRMVAAVSQYVETGTCHAYAASTAPLHAAKLADRKDERSIVALSNHATIDHVWSEMLPKGKRDDGSLILHGKDVIMDGWCKENVAILREDSRFARLDKDGKAGDLTHRDFLSHETGPEALRSVENIKAQIKSSPALEGAFHGEVERLVATGFKPVETGLWNAETVFHADFRQEAVKALHKDAKDTPLGIGPRIQDPDPVSKHAKHVSMAEIQAVGVDRSLGANIRGAKAEAPRIIASAKELFPPPKSFFGRLSAFFGI